MASEDPCRCALGRRKPDGGFVFIAAVPLLAAWWCYREGHISLRGLRVWLALHEMKARRCELDSDRKPAFGLPELERLVGGVGGEHLRRELRSLERLGLARARAGCITLLESVENLKVDDLSGVFTLLEKVENRRRRIPVPRRALRWMAAAASRVLLATVIGHALRLLYFRKGLVEPRGRCKASWVADVFDVDERGVRRARRKLLELGVLERAEADSPREHVCENRWGRAFVWNLEWSRSVEETEASDVPAHRHADVAAETDTGLPPLSDLSTTCLPGPESDREPSLREDSKNQKPRRGPAGASSKKDGGDAPTLRDVQLKDLRSTARLLALFGEAVQRGLVTNTDGGQLNFVSAAEHALAYGERPPALFSHIVWRGLWKFITQDDEDAASKRLKQELFGHGLPERDPPKYDPVSGEVVSREPEGVALLLSRVVGSLSPEAQRC